MQHLHGEEFLLVHAARFDARLKYSRCFAYAFLRSPRTTPNEKPLKGVYLLKFLLDSHP